MPTSLSRLSRGQIYLNAEIGAKAEFELKDIAPVIEEILLSGGEFRFFPRGRSMLPLIRQGVDSVLLVPMDDAVNRFDILLYKRDNGMYVMHRIYKISDDGTYVMCGDNQTVYENGIRKEQLIGKVRAVYRKNKELRMDSVSQRFYMLLWRTKFVRGCCLFVYRTFRKLGSLFRGNK